MTRNTPISRILKPLAQNPYQAYLSKEVQVADVLEWILTQLGDCDVWQTSFSVSEEFLRRLFFIKKGGRIKNYSLLLDFKATQKTLKLWSFIAQVIDNVALADNHSKILLARNSFGQCVSVVTSQNLTRGNRLESAFLTTDIQIYTALDAQLNDVLKNHSIPFHDLYRRAVSPD